MTISTDNKENLGKEPVLQYERRGKKQDFPMVYDGQYYTTKVIVRPDKYRIFYKDTGKYERNGEYQIINPLYYVKIATQHYRKQNNLPLENSIARGEVEGKVFVNTLDIPQDIPAILILDEITTQLDVKTQFEIVHLLKELQKNQGMSYILITHDLRVANALSHTVISLSSDPSKLPQIS